MSDEETTGNASPEAPAPEPAAPVPEVTLSDIADALGSLSDRLERLENPEAPAPPPPDPGLPEGTARFVSPIRDYIFTYVSEEETIINGQVVLVPSRFREVRSQHDHARTLSFIGGVADVTTPALADYLRAHPDFGRDFFEDASAHRQLGGTVLTGARGSHTQPQAAPALSAVIPD